MTALIEVRGRKTSIKPTLLLSHIWKTAHTQTFIHISVTGNKTFSFYQRYAIKHVHSINGYLTKSACPIIFMGLYIRAL